MLSTDIQKFIVSSWRHSESAKRHIKELLDCFNNLTWIEKNSGGEPIRNELLSHCFAVEKEVITLEKKTATTLRSRL